MTAANHSRTGVWIVGILGEVAVTVTVGTLALRRGLTSTTGLTTEQSPLSRLELAPLESLVFGGHDVQDCSLTETARALTRRHGGLSADILAGAADAVEAVEGDITIDARLAWSAHDVAPTLPPLTELIDQQRRLLRGFITRHDLRHLVVVDLSSAEPPVPQTPGHGTLEGFEALIQDDRKDLIPPSTTWAYAAFQEGCSHINFTPNTGAAVRALHDLAVSRGAPYYGSDGKTGETLVKTALAPMFLNRNMRVLSWEGINLLGNNDGKTLSDARHRTSKLANKAAVLPRILGYPVHADVTINYVPSLGDWKTAWNLIHFQGFLDVPMTMQFTWQGCDSVLAAPLVLDTVRLSEFAARHGEAGPMHHLAAFFKNPIEVEEMNFFAQFEMLLDYARGHLTRTPAPPDESCG